MWLFIAFFAIAVSLGSEVRRDPTTFSLWKILFEIVSAYGNVGLSLGIPDAPGESFAAAWTPLAKFILCIVMLFGRHRGMPDSIDPAVDLSYLTRPLEGIKARKRAATITGDVSRRRRGDALAVDGAEEHETVELRGPDQFCFFA
jgi:hypothetical protein